MPDTQVLPRLLDHAGAPQKDELTKVEPEMICTVRSTPRLKIMCVSVPEAGHLVPTAQIANAMAKRGHKVQLVSLACGAGKVSKSCAEVGCDFVGLSPEVAASDSGKGNAADLMKKNMMVSMFQYYDEQMTDPLRCLVLKEQPDMILADFVTPCAFKVAEQCGIPMVINVPGPLSLLTSMLPSTSIIMFSLQLGRKVSFAEGLAIFKFFGRLRPFLQSRTCLVNTFIGLDKPQPIASNVLVTGPTAPRYNSGDRVTSSQAFNDWLAWVRSEGLPLIYVTMGSMQKLEDFQVKAIYNGLAKLNCAVAWSLKADQQGFLPTGMDGLPRRFHIQSWMPQNEALQLPEVALVITHCGFGGLNETIAAGRPIVALPFRADQPMNAALAKERGIAEVLDATKLSALSVEQTVSKVLKDKSYARSAQEMQRMLLKTGGADTCADALELLARSGEQKGSVRSSASRRPNLLMMMPVLLGVGLVAFRLRSK